MSVKKKRRNFDIKIGIRNVDPEKVKQQQNDVPPSGKSLCPSGVDNQRHVREEAGKRSGPMKLCDWFLPSFISICELIFFSKTQKLLFLWYRHEFLLNEPWWCRFWTHLYLFFCIRLLQVRRLWRLQWPRAQPRAPTNQMQNLKRGSVGQRLSVCGSQELIHLHLTVASFRRSTQMKSGFLFLSTLETDCADDLRGRGDQDPAVDWHRTRGLSTVLDALWSQSSFLVRPPQVRFWIPAFRPTAHIHHLTVCPHCWQTQSSSCFYEDTEKRRHE